MIIEGSGAGARSRSEPRTNGSRSRRPKNIQILRIRIRNTVANKIRFHCTGAHVSARRMAVQLPREPAAAQQGGQAGAGRRNTN